MENNKSYSTELEVGRKKVKIIFEIPCTVDAKDADRFEQMLKSMYLNKIQTVSLQSGLSAEPFLTPSGKGEMSHE